MRCMRFHEIISAFLDAEASPLEQLALQEHLKNCPLCKSELSSQYTLRGMIKEHAVIPERVDLAPSVMARIRQLKEAPEEVLVDGPRYVPQWVAVAVTLIVTVLAIFSAHQGNPNFAGDATKNYATYIFEHVNDSDEQFARNVSYKQISLRQ